jgi:hypothetical protein
MIDMTLSAPAARPTISAAGSVMMYLNIGHNDLQKDFGEQGTKLLVDKYPFREITEIVNLLLDSYL